MTRRYKKQCASITYSPNVGAELEADDVEFAMAMTRYRVRNGRGCPSWSEVRAVFLSLGYRKTAPKKPPPLFSEMKEAGRIKGVQDRRIARRERA